MEESKKLVEDAEKSAGYDVRRHLYESTCELIAEQTETGADGGEASGRRKSRFDFILQKCRKSTKVCIELVMDVVERGASALSSAFGTSAAARQEL